MSAVLQHLPASCSDGFCGADDCERCRGTIDWAEVDRLNGLRERINKFFDEDNLTLAQLIELDLETAELTGGLLTGAIFDGSFDLEHYRKIFNAAQDEAREYCLEKGIDPYDI